MRDTMYIYEPIVFSGCAEVLSSTKLPFLKIMGTPLKQGEIIYEVDKADFMDIFLKFLSSLLWHLFYLFAFANSHAM